MTETKAQIDTWYKSAKNNTWYNAGYDEAVQGKPPLLPSPGYSNAMADDCNKAYLAGYFAAYKEREGIPIVVCLCGSTRFWRTFQRASLDETIQGRIVLSIGAASGTDDEHFGNLPRAEYDALKDSLDALHKRKIELADEVLILDVGGYIGESTRSELNYALSLGKRVRYWSFEHADYSESTPAVSAFSVVVTADMILKEAASARRVWQYRSGKGQPNTASYWLGWHHALAWALGNCDGFGGKVYPPSQASRLKMESPPARKEDS